MWGCQLSGGPKRVVITPGGGSRRRRDLRRRGALSSRQRRRGDSQQQPLPPSLAVLAGPVRRPSGPPHHPDYKFRPPVLRLQSPLPARGLLQAVTTRLSWSGASDSPPSDGRRGGCPRNRAPRIRGLGSGDRARRGVESLPGSRPAGGSSYQRGRAGSSGRSRKRRTPSLTLPAPSLASRAIPYALRPHT